MHVLFTEDSGLRDKGEYSLSSREHSVESFCIGIPMGWLNEIKSEVTFLLTPREDGEFWLTEQICFCHGAEVVFCDASQTTLITSTHTNKSWNRLSRQMLSRQTGWFLSQQKVRRSFRLEAHHNRSRLCKVVGIEVIDVIGRWSNVLWKCTVDEDTAFWSEQRTVPADATGSPVRHLKSSNVKGIGRNTSNVEEGLMRCLSHQLLRGVIPRYQDNRWTLRIHWCVVPVLPNKQRFCQICGLKRGMTEVSFCHCY